MKLKIKKYKEKNKFCSLLMLGGWLMLVSCVYLIFNNDDINKFSYLIILPFAYSVTRTLLRHVYYCISPGLVMYEMVTFLRFTILPFTILKQGNLSTFAVNYNHLDIAIGLMVYEIILCSLLIAFYHPRFKHSKSNVYMVGNGKLVFFLSCISIFLLYVDNRALTGNVTIFSGMLNTNVATQLSETSGLVSIIWQALWTYLFAYVIWSIYINSKIKNNRIGSAVLSALVCIVYYFVIFTGQASISRWYVIISAVASIVWLLILYPNNRRSILLTVGIPFVLVLLMVTVIKNVGLDALEYSRTEQISAIVTPNFVDSYLAGPVNINNAIVLKEQTEIGISSLPYDIVNNMPLINNYIDRTQSSAAEYNRFLGRRDQIIPLIGQSFTWFGFVFAPLLSMISVALFMNLDVRFHEVYGIDKYKYAFFAVWCGTETVLNMTIWLSWLYIRIIPMFLLFGVAHILLSKSSQKTF